jgi:hypothetical protein
VIAYTLVCFTAVETRVGVLPREAPLANKPKVGGRGALVIANQNRKAINRLARAIADAKLFSDALKSVRFVVALATDLDLAEMCPCLT